jgi:hypothetical protein
MTVEAITAIQLISGIIIVEFLHSNENKLSHAAKGEV